MHNDDKLKYPLSRLKLSVTTSRQIRSHGYKTLGTTNSFTLTSGSAFNFLVCRTLRLFLACGTAE